MLTRSSTFKILVSKLYISKLTSKQIENYVYIRCDDTNASEIGGILNYEFYLSPTNIYENIGGTELICADSSVTITASEQD